MGACARGAGGPTLGADDGPEGARSVWTHPSWRRQSRGVAVRDRSMQGSPDKEFTEDEYAQSASC